MSTKLYSTLHLSVGGILCTPEIVGAEYYPKGSLRSDALLNGGGERHEVDFLFVNVKDQLCGSAGKKHGVTPTFSKLRAFGCIDNPGNDIGRGK